MKNIVYFFSGTGNSFYTAKKAAAKLECECRDIADTMNNNGEKEAFEKALIVFPSYGYGAPSPVLRFLKNLPFSAEYIAIAVTCGSYSEGTMHSAKRVLKRRKVVPSFYLEIGAPENFLPIFGAPKEALLERRLKILDEKTNELILAMTEERTNDVRGLKPFSAIVSHIFLAFLPILALFMRTGKKSCTSCGLCAKFCPMKAIKMRKKGGIRIRKTKCAMCQRCLNVCPRKCITLARVSKKSGRYFHPDVKISELKAKQKDN